MKVENYPDGSLRVQTGTPWEPLVGYSRAVRKGPRVWVAGTTAVENGEVCGGDDAYLQAKECLLIIQKALEMLGAGIADVVRTRMYVIDIQDWEAIGQAHGEFFGNVRPAATMVEVKALIDPRLRVEIEVEAWVG